MTWVSGFENRYHRMIDANSPRAIPVATWTNRADERFRGIFRNELSLPATRRLRSSFLLSLNLLLILGFVYLSL
jgi:hypothetical protein